MVSTAFCFKCCVKTIKVSISCKILWTCTIVALLTLIAQRFDQPGLLHTVGLIRGIANKVSKPINEIMIYNNIDWLLDIVLMLPEVGPNRQRRLKVLWRTLVGDTIDYSNSLPATIEMEESFYQFFCTKMAMLLVQSRVVGLEDEVFWQKHATYEKFALQEGKATKPE